MMLAENVMSNAFAGSTSISAMVNGRLRATLCTTSNNIILGVSSPGGTLEVWLDVNDASDLYSQLGVQLIEADIRKSGFCPKCGVSIGIKGTPPCSHEPQEVTNDKQPAF